MESYPMKPDSYSKLAELARNKMQIQRICTLQVIVFNNAVNIKCTILYEVLR